MHCWSASVDLCYWSQVCWWPMTLPQCGYCSNLILPLTFDHLCFASSGLQPESDLLEGMRLRLPTARPLGRHVASREKQKPPALHKVRTANTRTKGVFRKKAAKILAGSSNRSRNIPTVKGLSFARSRAASTCCVCARIWVDNHSDCLARNINTLKCVSMHMTVKKGTAGRTISSSVGLIFNK